MWLVKGVFTWSIVKMPQPIFSHSRLTATNKVQNWHKNYLADMYVENKEVLGRE